MSNNIILFIDFEKVILNVNKNMDSNGEVRWEEISSNWDEISKNPEEIKYQTVIDYVNRKAKYVFVITTCPRELFDDIAKKVGLSYTDVIYAEDFTSDSFQSYAEKTVGFCFYYYVGRKYMKEWLAQKNVNHLVSYKSFYPLWDGIKRSDEEENSIIDFAMNCRKWNIHPTFICEKQEDLLRKLTDTPSLTAELRETYEKTGIYYLFDYYPQNSFYDEFSLCMEKTLKEGESDILNLYSTMSMAINKNFDEGKWSVKYNDRCGIFLVPSSEQGKWNENIWTNVYEQRLKHRKYYGAKNALFRSESTIPAHLQEGRGTNILSHKKTIKLVGRLGNSWGMRFLKSIILDDITTTGASMNACRDIVAGGLTYRDYEKGSMLKNIYCVAFGKTVEHASYNKYLFYKINEAIEREKEKNSYWN